MAKSTGTISVTIDNSSNAGKDLSLDILSVTTSTPRTHVDVTSVGAAAMERLATLIDGKATLKGQWDSDANLAHAVLSTMTSSTATRTCVFVYPGSKTLTMECYIEDYQLDYSAGNCQWSVSLVLADGVAPAWT